MIKKMYSNYEINKKYAIRKLSIGAFSIAIGLFASNMNELPVIGTHLGPSIVHAAEPEVTNWQPEGNIIARGEDGVPWELYENGYLLFKPEPGKDTLTNGYWPYHLNSWKNLYYNKIKAIGFTDKVYLPEDASYFFKSIKRGDLPDIYLENEDNNKNLSNLEFIDTSKIDTSKTINMDSLFLGVKNIESLNLNNWDTSKVTSMSGMFYMSGFKGLNLNNWDTSKVTNMSAMFDYASNLTSLDVSNWNTSKVTSMSGMFEETGNISNLKINNWNTSSVKYMSNMFANSKINNIDLSNWDLSNVESIDYMFYGTNFKTLNLGNWNTSNIRSMQTVFPNVVNLNLKNWNTQNIYPIRVTHFLYLPKAKKIKIGSNLNNNQNLFMYLDKHYYGDLYTNRWIKEDGNAGPYTVDEWWNAYTSNPVNMSGTWIREKKHTDTEYKINFNTTSNGTNETIYPLRVEVNETPDLPTPEENKLGYKFLGWSKTEDGEIIKDTTNIGQPGETVTLYAKWEKVDNVRKENTPIEMTTVYEGDEELEKGTNKEINGVPGEKEIITTYEVTPITGELINPSTTENIITPMTPKTIKVGTKPKVVYSKDGDDIVKSTTIYIVDPNNGTISENTTKETFNKDGVKTKVEVTPIPSPNKYVKDDTREKGADNIIEQGTPGSKTVTTTYDVNPEDGSKIENVGNPVIVNPTDTIIKVAAKNKVEIVKEKGQTIERTTNYTVNEKTGEISETVTDKLISSSTPLIPNINGSDLPDEPELNTNEKPEYKESVSTNTTTDEKGNEILPPVLEELPEYNGGANPTDSPVNEKPEYTEELSTNTPIDENDNPILPPVVDELPEFTGSVNPSDAPIHEIPEYTNSLSTNTPVDENGELVLPPVIEELPEYNGNINHTETPVNEVSENIVLSNNSIVNNTEKSETTKEENKKERKLPDTNSSSVIASLVSSVIGTLGLGYKFRSKEK